MLFRSMDPHLIILLTLFISAFSSGVEIAFVSSSRLRIELDKNKGSVTGKILGFFYRNEGHFLAALLLGNNIALVLFGIQAAKILNPIIASWGVTDQVLQLLIQTVISTILVLIIAEFLPKAVCQLNPNAFMKSFAFPAYLFYWILYLPTSIIMFISLRFLKLMKVEISSTEKVFSKVDLEHYVQDMNEQDVLDSDAFSDHEGGFAAAASLLNSAPAIYHVDATRSDRQKVRTLSEEIARVVRGRATNPRWIEGQMRHGHRGASEIAETVNNLYSFAVSTECVTSRQFELMFEATLGNDRVRTFLLQENPEAGKAIARNFMNAVRRGFWMTRRNSTVSLLSECGFDTSEIDAP